MERIEDNAHQRLEDNAHEYIGDNAYRGDVIENNVHERTQL